MDPRSETIDVTEIADGKPHPGRRMTEEEFVAWADEDTRAEWVDGEVIVISPTSRKHTRLVGFVFQIMNMFVEEHDLGEVLGGEYTTRISQGASTRRRLPDVLFVATDRLSFLKKNHLEGAPNLIVEVVSPDSVARDWREKYHEYEQAGVREYWVIDPLAKRVEGYALGADCNYTPIPETEGALHSTLLTGFFLKPAWLFQDPLPKIREVMRDLGLSALS